jgi:hypothetical protein
MTIPVELFSLLVVAGVFDLVLTIVFVVSIVADIDRFHVGVFDLVLTIVFAGFFLITIRADTFVTVIEKDLRAENFGRIVKFFRGLSPVPVARYGQFLFSLRIPQKTLRGFGGGFRDAGPAVDFEQVLEEESERARMFFEKPVHRLGAIGVMAAVLALLASAAFLLLLRTWPFDGTTPFDGYPAVAVGLGVVAIVLGQSVARTWRKTILGIRLVKTRIQPLMVAKEDMPPARVEAAEDAKKHRLLEPMNPDA